MDITITYTIGNQKPIVTITSPADDNVTIDEFPLTVAGTIVEENIQLVELIISTLALTAGSLGDIIPTGTLGRDITFTIDITQDVQPDGSFSHDVNTLGNGTYDIKVECTNEAGDKGADVVHGIIINVVAGNATKIQVETRVDGTGTVVPAQDLASGLSITAYAISRDDRDNFVSLVTDATWSLESITGGVVTGDLVDNTDGSATLTGALVGSAEIQAVKTGFPLAKSGAITVIPGAPVKLGIATQPGGGSVGELFLTQPVILIQDAQGNLIDDDSTTKITVVIGDDGSPNTDAELGGVKEVVASFGVAVFTDLSIDKAGVGYTLVFISDSGHTSIESVPFNIITSPWPIAFNPASPYWIPISGWAKVDVVHLVEGDWVGVFGIDPVSKEESCYGFTQYVDRPQEEYTMSVYAAFDGETGFTSNERMYFKFYVNDPGAEIDAVSVIEGIGGSLTLAPQRYDVFNQTGLWQDASGVRMVNLINAAKKSYTLHDGWNFISFNVQPENTELEDAFRSLLTGSTDYLEYVTSHDKFWWKNPEGTPTGNLTDVDAYNSYYLKVVLPPGENATLEITGLMALPTYEFNLVGNEWNNISYLLENNTYAIFDPTVNNGQGADTGVFSGIQDSIVWIKGPDGRFAVGGTPSHGRLLLEPGKGLFVKMYSGNDVPFAYEDTP